jgi:ATP-dependent Clp protease, protease subunit
MTKMNDVMALGAKETIDTTLLKNHTYFLSGTIDEDSIEPVIRWIMYENMMEEEGKVLTLYINSSGGGLYDAFALVDMMRKSAYPISTVGIGSVCSAAFVIFAAGTKGHRYMSENTSILSHQFTGDTSGKYHDMISGMKENEYANDRMKKVLSESTGLTEKAVKAKLLPPSDVWLTPAEAVALGAADHIF